jgi:hypothetical protein
MLTKILIGLEFHEKAAAILNEAEYINDEE